MSAGPRWVRTGDLPMVVVLLSSNQSTVANLGGEKRSLEKNVVGRHLVNRMIVKLR